MNVALEKYRVRGGRWATKTGELMGMFLIPADWGKVPLTVLSAPFDGGEEWEHVSVSLPHRCPTWGEMCRVKDLFWEKSACVVQYHPAESEYVNTHKFCLHLWRWARGEFPAPPSHLVG